MATTSKKVYLAPDVLFAFIDRTHAKHDQAAAFFRYFALEEYHLFIDTVSLYESYRQIEADISPSIAKDFIRTLTISGVVTFYPDESDMRAALKIYINDKTGELTFQKSIMVVMADRRGVGQIATFQYIHSMFGLTIFYIPI
jgi:predicted nucleic acid-binding protein